MDGEGHLTFGLFFEEWGNPGGKAQLQKAVMQPAVGKGDPDAILHGIVLRGAGQEPGCGISSEFPITREPGPDKIQGGRGRAAALGSQVCLQCHADHAQSPGGGYTLEWKW